MIFAYNYYCRFLNYLLIEIVLFCTREKKNQHLLNNSQVLGIVLGTVVLLDQIRYLILSTK